MFRQTLTSDEAVGRLPQDGFLMIDYDVEVGA